LSVYVFQLSVSFLGHKTRTDLFTEEAAKNNRLNGKGKQPNLLSAFPNNP